MTLTARLAGEAGISSDPESRRFLAHSELDVGPRTRLVIAAIADRRTIDELRPTAAVEPMLPHDALLVLDRTDPDILLVDTAALLPARPWAQAGHPSAGDRGRRLVEILRAARSRDCPTVLWWNGRRDHAVGLIPLERLFDLVIATDVVDASDLAVPWTTGVQLRRWNPLGTGEDRPRNPVFVWRHEAITWHAAKETRALLSSVTADGLEIWRDSDEPVGGVPLPREVDASVLRSIDPRRLPDRLREHGLFLADPVTSVDDADFIRPTTLQELASGGRVVSGRNLALSESFGEMVAWIDDPEGAPDAVRDGAARGPLSVVERRDALRAIHHRHATPVALATLGGYLDLPPTLTPARDVCVVARIGPETRAIDVVDGLLIQEERPAEAMFLTDDPAPLHPHLLELEQAGVRGRVAPPPDRGVSELQWAADLTERRWLWAWAPRLDLPPTFVLDCLTGAEMAQAAAVGLVDGDADRFVDELPVSRALVARREVRDWPDPDDGDLRSWARRGARLLGMTIPSGTSR